MLAAVDDSLRKLVDRLKEKGMWENTFLVVTSDNGGMPNVEGSIVPSAGVNYPYRGGKGLAFEGGVKGIGFVNGGVIPGEVRGTKNTQLIHAVDWFPTLVNLAVNGSEGCAGNGRCKALPANLDGYDLWDVLMNNASIDRTVLPLNINHEFGYPSSGHQVAIISGDWKLILQEISGPVFNYDGWFPAPPGQWIPPPKVPDFESPYNFLFNLTADPYEQNNLYYFYPVVVSELESILTELDKKYEPEQFNFPNPLGFPELHDGVWAPFWDL